MRLSGRAAVLARRVLALAWAWSRQTRSLSYICCSTALTKINAVTHKYTHSQTYRHTHIHKNCTHPHAKHPSSVTPPPPHARNQHTSTCRTAFPRTNSNPGPHPAQPFESARPPDRDLSDEAAKRTGFYLFPFIPSRGLLHTVHRIKRKQVKNERKKKTLQITKKEPWPCADAPL